MGAVGGYERPYRAARAQGPRWQRTPRRPRGTAAAPGPVWERASAALRYLGQAAASCHWTWVPARGARRAALVVGVLAQRSHEAIIFAQGRADRVRHGPSRPGLLVACRLVFWAPLPPQAEAPPAPAAAYRLPAGPHPEHRILRA